MRTSARTTSSLALVAFLVLGIIAASLETAYSPSFGDPMEMGYVDFARHMAAGEGMSTSMLAPYYAPKIPSPISLWPPLYPAAIALTSKLGFSVPVAARLVSIVAFGVSVALVYALGSMVFGETAGVISAFLLSIWPPVTRIAGMALSESMFVAAVLLSLVITVHLFARKQAIPRAYLTAAGAGAAMGAAALTRYVGLALIPVGAVALLLSLQERSWRERLGLATVWATAGIIPPALGLLRNFMVTGSVIGAGRLPNERSFVYHVVFSVKTVVLDGLGLLWRVTIVPEALGLGGRWGALGILLVVGLVMYGIIRGGQFRARLIPAIGAVFASPASRFVMAIALGYWGAMLAARERMGFMALSTRMMMPVYPLLLLCTVAIVVGLTDVFGPVARGRLTRVVAVLCIGATVGLIGPRSLAAGGPRLQPGPPPPWVTWVAANTPTGAPIVGNGGFDYNFYLERPVLSFGSYLDYRTGDRFDRDCRRIARNLDTLGWRQAYLILHAEERELDVEMMGRRYGPTIVRLLKGETPLPVRQLARQPEFIVFEILSLSWDCART